MLLLQISNWKVRLYFMKKLIKNLIKKYSNLPIVNFIFYQRKYQNLGFGLLTLNTICQRIFCINVATKWQVHFTSRVTRPENIIIHNRKDNASVFLSFSSSGGCYMQANNGIEIYENVTWSYGVHLISANHSFVDYNVHEKKEPIVLGKNVWIGANSVILPSVVIGEFAIVGAGSIVTKNVPAYSINVGNPAKVIGYRCINCLNKIQKIDEINICNTCKYKYDKKDYK